MAVKRIKIEIKPRVESDFPLATDDLEYSLEMDHPLLDAGNLEEISLTRDEYIAAKALVAKMRGFKPEAKAA